MLGMNVAWTGCVADGGRLDEATQRAPTATFLAEQITRGSATIDDRQH
jgi:hypothetical protein